MPLTPKDDVSGEVERTKESDSAAVAELRDRLNELEERTEVPFGLDTLDELNEAHQSRQEALEERVDTLEERVDRQETVLYDLIDLVEALAAGMDANGLDKGFTRVENEGTDAYPFRWHTDTLDFKSERYE